MNWVKQVRFNSRELSRFTGFVITHFINDGCTYRASALAFTSLLAVVPLMTISLAILSSFPVFQGLSQPLQDFIFQNFVPETEKILQNYLQTFVAQVSKLSIFGIAFVLVTALLVMFTIERAMNKIWRVPIPRHGMTAFLLYWAILSLAPIFLGLSLTASSYLLSLPFFKADTTHSILIHLAPFILSLTGFTFLYVVVPNYPVKLRHGLCGGLFAAILFESAKLAFAYYLIRYNMYELLYGAFAIIPVFFVWVYWVWFITLLGAEISYAVSVQYQWREGKPLPPFIHALIWLQALWLAPEDNKSLSLETLIASSTRPYALNAEDMIHELIQAGFIHRTAESQFMLSRDMSKMTVYDFSQKLPFLLPSVSDLNDLDTRWQGLFIRYQDDLKESLSISLAALFKETRKS